MPESSNEIIIGFSVSNLAQFCTNCGIRCFLAGYFLADPRTRSGFDILSVFSGPADAETACRIIVSNSAICAGGSDAVHKSCIQLLNRLYSDVY